MYTYAEARNRRRTSMLLAPIEESMMADDKTNRGEPDRSRVAAGEGYEVEYFARKHGITVEQARELIDRVGNDRGALDAAAAKLK